MPIDANAERRKFLIKERLIDPLKPLGWWLDRRRVAQMRESKAWPGPVYGVLDQASANRIAKDIAESGEKMSVLLNRKTFEPALPDMPMAPVMPMVAPDVAGHPPLHEGTQDCISGWLHDQ